MGKPYAKEGPSAEDKALDLFADMMIERIQSLSGKDGWKKPWFTEGALQWPKNLNGREYNGMNAMMLLLHCEKEGYKIPRFCTFDRIQQFNKTGKKDEEQKPRVSVLKGEHSFPVMLTTFTVVNKETKEHIKWEDYKLLSQEEREKYNVYPKLQTYHVFNVAQTNLKEVRPEFWEKLEQEYSMPKVEKDEQFAFEPVDRMIADNRWICPIKPMFGDSAYFSISKNEIVMPEKRQFKDGGVFLLEPFPRDGTLHGCGGTVRPHQARYLRLGRVCTRGTGGRTDGCADRSAVWHDKASERRFGCLFEVLAGFAEGVAAVHQDHATRCEKSYLNAHAAYRQDCYGDRPGEKG